jgi:hypothetical protein
MNDIHHVAHISLNIACAEIIGLPQQADIPHVSASTVRILSSWGRQQQNVTLSTAEDVQQIRRRCSHRFIGEFDWPIGTQLVSGKDRIGVSLLMAIASRLLGSSPSTAHKRSRVARG